MMIWSLYFNCNVNQVCIKASDKFEKKEKLDYATTRSESTEIRLCPTKQVYA